MACQTYSFRWSTTQSTVENGGGLVVNGSFTIAGSVPAINDNVNGNATCSSSGPGTGGVNYYVAIDDVSTLRNKIYTVDGSFSANNGKIIAVNDVCGLLRNPSFDIFQNDLGTCASPCNGTTGSTVDGTFCSRTKNGFYTFYPQECIPYWNTTAPDSIIEVWGNNYQGVPAYDGTNFIEINASSSASQALYQTFSASIGTSYQLQFAHRGRNGFLNTMQVGLSGSTGINFFPIEYTGSTTQWNLQAYGFTASESEYNLIFSATSSQNGGNFLDAIDIVCSSEFITPSPTPSGVPASQTPTPTPPNTPPVTPTISLTTTPTVSPLPLYLSGCTGGTVYQVIRSSWMASTTGTVLISGDTNIPDGCYTFIAETSHVGPYSFNGTATTLEGDCTDPLCPTPSVTPTNTPTVSVSDTPAVTPTYTPTPSVTPSAVVNTETWSLTACCDSSDSIILDVNVPGPPNVYVFYDATSLGASVASGASESIRSWFNTQQVVGQVNQLYEGVIGMPNDNGENWIWWMSYPYLGSLTGGTLSDGITTIEEITYEVEYATYDADHCSGQGPNGWCIPNRTEFNDSNTVYQNINRGLDSSGNPDSRSNGVPFNHVNLSTTTNSGPGTFNGEDTNYIVINIVDEADGTVGLYHGSIGVSIPYPFYLAGSGWSPPIFPNNLTTDRVQHDYEAYLQVWEDIKLQNGRINSLVYPVVDNNPSRESFVPHVVGIVEGETIDATEYLNKYGEPITSVGPENLNLLGLSSINVFSAFTATTAYQNLDSSFQNGPGLKNFGVVADPTVTGFTEAFVAERLDVFIDSTDLSQGYGYTYLGNCYSFSAETTGTAVATVEFSALTENICDTAPCICITPTPTQSVTPTNTPPVTPTLTQTPGGTPPVTPTNTPTVTVSDTPSVTPTNTPTVSVSDTPAVTPTNTPTVTVSDTPSVTPTNTPTVSVSDTPGTSTTPTPTVSDTPAVTPTNTPTVTSTITPTFTPTVSVSDTPSVTPTNTPTPSSGSDLIQLEYCCGGYFVLSGYTSGLTIGVVYKYNWDGVSDECATVVDYSGSGPTYIYTFGNPVVIPGDCSYGECPSCVSPTPTQTQTETPTPTPTNTPAITPSVTPTYTPTLTPSPTDSINCVEAVTDGTYFYTDCCGFYRAGQSVGELVTVDTTLPYSGLSINGTPATQNCDEGELDYNFSITGTCSDVSGGTITISPIGGVPPYTIDNITPGTLTGGTSNMPFTWTGLTEGNYVFRLNDSLGDSNSEIYININIDGCLTAIIDEFSGTTCGNDNGFLSVSGDSTSLPYLISLYQNAVLYNSQSSNINPTDYLSLPNGDYYAIVEDYGGATAQTQTVTISGVSSLDYGLAVTGTSACGFTEGSISVTGLTGTSPFTYLWSNGSTGDTITGLSANTYSVTVTDANGCELTKSATITTEGGLDLLAYSVTPTGCLTNDGEVQVFISGGTQPYTYLGSNGQTGTTSATTFTFTGVSSGTFTVTINDEYNCQLVEEISVPSEGGIDSVNISTALTNCGSLATMNITLQGNGSPFTYSYTGQTNYDSGSITTSSKTHQFTGLSADTYDVKVESANGCCYTTTVTITTSPKYTIDLSTSGETCGLANGAVTINVNSGYTGVLDYILSDGQQIIDYGFSSYTFTNLSTGLYSVTVTDSENCSVTENFNITGTTGVVVSLTKTECTPSTNASIVANVIQGTSPYTYTWSDGQTGSTATGLTAGTYSVIVEDAEGCSGSSTTTISCTNQQVSNYQLVTICEDTFTTTYTKRSMYKMLNDGYLTLVGDLGASGCTLTEAVFNYIIDFSGNTYTDSFYTGYTLSDVPSDDLWGDTVEGALTGITGIQGVEVNVINNTVIITGECATNEILTLSLKIDYDLDCSYVIPTPTPTQTVTPTNTPGPTPDITATPIIVSPTPTLTQTVSSTSTPIPLSATPSVTPSPTSTPTVTQTPTNTPTNTPTVTPTNTPTVSVSDTPGTSTTPTPTVSDTPAVTPTNTPTVTVSDTPSVTPSNTPTSTVTPTITPTNSSCVCLEIDTNIPFLATGNTVNPNNVLEIDYYDCDNNFITFSATTALVSGGVFYLCVKNGQVTEVRAWQGDILYIGDSTNFPPTSPSGWSPLMSYGSGSPANMNYGDVSSTYPCVGGVCGPVMPTPTNTPTTTVTPTQTISPTITPSVSVTLSVSVSNTPGVSGTATPTVTQTPTQTPTNTATVTQTNTSTPTPTISETSTPTVTPTISETSTPTVTPTISETSTPTVTPTVTPSTSQTVFYYTMSPCDGVSPNFTAQSNTSKTIGTAWNITGGPNAGVCATIIGESAGPSTDIIGIECSCVTPTPTVTVSVSATPPNTPTKTATPSVTPSVQFYFYLMSPCDGVSPNFVARSNQSGLSGTYEVSGSGYVGVIATIVGSTVAPHVATLLGASSCSSPTPTPTKTPTPTPTPTRTPTPTPSYNYYNVRSLRPDCAGLLPGTNEVLRTTQNLSTGAVVGPSPGQCYEVQGTTSPQTPDYTGPWSVFVSCGVCQTP